jgi:hypothetical protein
VKAIIKELHNLDVAYENIFSWRFFPSCFYSQPATKMTALDYYTKRLEDIEDKIKLKQQQYESFQASIRLSMRSIKYILLFRGKERKAPLDSGFIRMSSIQSAKEVVFFYNNGLFEQNFEIDFAPGSSNDLNRLFMLSISLLHL